MSTSEIDGLLQRAVADRALPGVVAMVGDRDGTTYEGAFGLLNIDGDDRVRPDTMFAIMSMTKAFTSVAALQLIEQGALELQQPVADILPAFADLQVLEGFDGDTPRLREPAESGDDSPPADTHLGPGLFVHQRRHPALPPGQREPPTSSPASSRCCRRRLSPIRAPAGSTGSARTGSAG